MGCDIHLYVERRENGRWVTADLWTPNQYYKPGNDEGEDPFTVEYDNRFYTQRSYNLFGMLANVRNGRGFAGIKTGEGFIPIAMPRGLPEDVCDEVRHVSERWGVDGHSHSWFTVSELLRYDWNQTTQHQGVVDAVNYLLWKYEGKPRSWAGSVDGPSVKHVSNAEMDEVINRGWAENHYTLVRWSEPYHASAGRFYTETLPKLQGLGNPDDVRIVFFFDN